MATFRPIAFIGRIDPEGTLHDGQTVKTRTLWRLMVRRYGEAGVVCVDTKDHARRPLRVLSALARALLTCGDAVVLLSRGGRRALFPLLALASRLRGTRVYHCLVGGVLADDVRADASGRLRRQLNSFRLTWVESPRLARELEGLGVRGVRCLPNFKDLTPADPATLTLPRRASLRLYTLGRVCAAKGIPDAARAVAALNEAGLACELDVFGPVERQFAGQLDAILAANPHVRYRGVVDAEAGARTVGAYAAFLFPTRWAGEGMPGAVIDALAAGVPVLAYRWRYYDDMLQDGVTGFGCEPGVEGLAGLVRRLASLDDSALMAMRRACVAHAGRYTADAVFGEMTQTIEAGRELGA